MRGNLLDGAVAVEQSRVELVGSLPQPTLAQELASCRLLAYPNHWPETFCIAAIEAQAAETAGLPTEERITLDIVRVVCDIELEQLGQRFDRLKVVDQMDGPQTILPLLAVFQRTEKPEQFEAFMARLADYPRFMAANIDTVRDGLASGVTAARIVTERVISQLERLLAIPDDQSPILESLKLPKPSDRDRLVEAVGKYVRPADRVFLEALLGKYREASRDEPGLCSAPNGDQLYKTQIRAWTSLDIEAAELVIVLGEDLTNTAPRASEMQSNTNGTCSPVPLPFSARVPV